MYVVVLNATLHGSTVTATDDVIKAASARHAESKAISVEALGAGSRFDRSSRSSRRTVTLRVARVRHRVPSKGHGQPWPFLRPRSTWDAETIGKLSTVHEYELTLVYRAADERDAHEIAEMIEGVLKQLDHPVTAAGPARLEPPLDPADE